MRYVPALLLLMTMPVLAATVWKWRDANGVMHYSDQPVPGAEPVSIQSSSTFTPTPTASRTSEDASSAASAPANITYTNVEIWKPNKEETIPNMSGQVGVGVRVEPELAANHRLALYLDGRLVEGFPERGSEYELMEVERGAHTLVLVVTDAKGLRVSASAPVQFYVQRPSILKPAAP